MRVEEERRQGAFEARPEAAIDRKTRAGYFRRALKIEDSGVLGDFPMRAGLEIKFWRRTPAAHLNIFGRAMSNRDRSVRAIGNGQHEVGQLRVQFRDAF